MRGKAVWLTCSLRAKFRSEKKFQIMRFINKHSFTALLFIFIFRFVDPGDPGPDPDPTSKTSGSGSTYSKFRFTVFRKIILLNYDLKGLFMNQKKT
jgi:hypothetical protein